MIRLVSGSLFVLVSDIKVGVDAGAFYTVAAPAVKSGVKIDGFGWGAGIGAGGCTISTVRDELACNNGTVDG